MNYLKNILIGLLIFVAGLFCAVWVLRANLLHFALKKAQERLKNKYNLELVFNDAKVIGISEAEFHGLSIIPSNRDTILRFDQINGKIDFTDALTGNFRLEQLSLKGGKLSFIRPDSVSNWDEFLKRNKSKEIIDSTESSNTDISRAVYEFIENTLDKVPDNVQVNDMNLFLHDRKTQINFQIAEMTFLDRNIHSVINIKSNETLHQWRMHGVADPSDMNGDVFIYSGDTGQVTLPYIKEKYDLTIAFDTLHLQLTEIDHDGDYLKINGFASLQNLLINHERIAKNPVKIGTASANYDFFLGPRFISLDSSSTFKINDISVHPYLKYNSGENSSITFNIRVDEMPAQNFLNSIPEGIFTNIDGLKAEGSIGYRMDFFMEKEKPWALSLNSDVIDKGLRLSGPGLNNLGKMAHEFSYTSYENGRAVRSFPVGPSHYAFTPLEQVSSYLKNAVLTSEDPSFFHHRGFIMESIRQAIATNYVAKRFKRGGSTISMQLVKNVYLTRDKVMLRKLEEMMLVWLIENLHLCSKERMFEVYLNIIEWGPGVYGIGEASQFYFSKHPSELTLAESIFLSSIIPRPKAFSWKFDDKGNLKPYMAGTYKLVSGRMVMRNMILPEDTAGLIPNIEIHGRAKEFIKIKDTIPETEIEDVDF